MEGNVPPNPTCTLGCTCPNPEGSGSCWTLWFFLPSASGVLTQHSRSWSAVFSRPHPNFTAAPHYRSHSPSGPWCGPLSDHFWSQGTTLSGVGFFGKLTSLRNFHPPGKGLDSQKAASRDGLRSLSPICRPPNSLPTQGLTGDPLLLPGAPSSGV